MLHRPWHVWLAYLLALALLLPGFGWLTVRALELDRAERLARARALQNRDEELARLQGIEERYRAVRDKIEALVGPRARPPFPDDPVTRENLRFLEARRETIERLQGDVRDPLSRAAADTGGR